VLGWEPSVTLEDGLAGTYRFIVAQLQQTGRLPRVAAAN
jgi:nucleoside-diphosphate-sugar epimerase